MGNLTLNRISKFWRDSLLKFMVLFIGVGFISAPELKAGTNKKLKITTSSSIASQICTGSIFIVPFTYIGKFGGEKFENLNSQNNEISHDDDDDDDDDDEHYDTTKRFNVELSSADGSFLTPLVIGSGDYSPIKCLIPIGTLPSSNYIVRVVSSNPIVIGSPSNIITLKKLPVIPSVINITRCGPGSTTLKASVDRCSGAFIKWYSSLSDTTSLFTGSNYTTNFLSTSTTFYAVSVDPNGCESVRIPTTASIRNFVIPIITSASTYTGIVDKDMISLYGSDLSVVDSVKFYSNKKSTQFLRVSSTELKVLVPIGSIDGSISIYDMCGSSSTNFNFKPVTPNIENIQPNILPGTYVNPIEVSLSSQISDITIYYTLDGSTPVAGSINTRRYIGPITIAKNLTLKAFGYRKGWVTSQLSTYTYSITNKLSVLKPKIIPATGTYQNNQLMTIYCDTPGATIYFTTNGQVPRPGINTPIRYYGPITLTMRTLPISLTLRAIAVRDGWVDSPVDVSYINIQSTTQLSPVVVSRVGGSYSTGFTMTLSNPDTLAKIHYTTDGTDPFRYYPLSKVYTGPFLIGKSTVLKAYATRDGANDSAPILEKYIIDCLVPSRISTDVNVDEVVSENIEIKRESVSYPNPTDGIFSIEFSELKEISNILVFNNIGILIKDIEIKNSVYTLDVDLSGETPGVYMVSIVDKFGIRENKRVIKR